MEGGCEAPRSPSPEPSFGTPAFFGPAPLDLGALGGDREVVHVRFEGGPKENGPLVGLLMEIPNWRVVQPGEVPGLWKESKTNFPPVPTEHIMHPSSQPAPTPLRIAHRPPLEEPPRPRCVRGTTPGNRRKPEEREKAPKDL